MGWMSTICDAHKKVGVELLYNSVKTGSQLVWRPDLLVTRCGRESQHLAEWALRPPIELLQFGDQTSWEKMLEWGHIPERLGPQALGSAAQENGKERLMAIRAGLICCSSFRSPTPSHTQPFQIKWEVYFSKRLCCSSLLCFYDFACICVCIVGHVHGYTTECQIICMIINSFWWRHFYNDTWEIDFPYYLLFSDDVVIHS